MKTLETIRKDLMEIRLYYSQQKQFEECAKVIPSVAAELAKAYNESVAKAPGRLYLVYMSLYVNNNTQETVAYDWGKSVDYIAILNKQLCQYFQEHLE
jgi:hypothetical protein